MQNYKTCPKCSGTSVPYTKGVGETFWNRRYMTDYKMSVTEPVFWKCTCCGYESAAEFPNPYKNIRIELNKQTSVYVR